ncbi:N-formylglutamate amidohydrolase domain protein [Burkholderia pseudomallei TSV44]|nr:putative n-formylglutamate amidohydrolase [Burkholderia pseudomallei MSHR3016]KGX50576.1 N-formylglutamate amidohydrolase domain protein [Burkholderia pseudomallei TSV44]
MACHAERPFWLLVYVMPESMLYSVTFAWQALRALHAQPSLRSSIDHRWCRTAIQ